MKIKRILIALLLTLIVLKSVTYANINEEDETISDNIQEEISNVSATIDGVPSINSKSAIVFDRTTGSILYSKNEQDVRKMASTTKIMTAIVVIENANLYETVTISKKSANTGGSTLGIKEGDKITVCDLLYGLLLKSGNDTAIALAEHVGGSVEGFADMMNNKAKELNLNNTHFVTPHGLDNDNHYTTAYDLAILTDYALRNKTFSNFVGSKSYTVTINGFPKTINNTNELLGNLNGVYGVKTGFTNGANRCLVTACRRENLDIICIVLGADNKRFRTQDSIKLIEYTYKTYKMIDLEELIDNCFNNWKAGSLSKFTVNKGLTSKVEKELKKPEFKFYPVKKKDINNISTSIACNYNLQAPVVANSSIGTLTVNIGEDIVLNYDILNTVNIDKKNIFTYLIDFVSNYFKYLTMKF